MNFTPIIYPLLAQVALTFGLMFIMAISRVKAAQARRYKLRDIAVNSANYPDDVRKSGNSYVNQFELPVLFYLVCVLLMIAGPGNNKLYLMMAWAFVGTRIVHAFIHVTLNNVIRRFYAFLAGAIILIAMWGLLAFEQLT
ncbi:MAG: MAPEG family protein [bacterium]|nr:MAPEG family protein [bacterium]